MAPSSTGLGQIAVSRGGFVMLMHPDSSALQDLGEAFVSLFAPIWASLESFH